MQHYESFEDLKGKTLAEGDKVIFSGEEFELDYDVNNAFLNLSGGGNSEIFRIVGIISERDKYEFASKYYGYQTERGDWPNAKENDYAALTRLVLAIYAGIEGVGNGETVGIETVREEIILHKEIMPIELPAKFDLKVASGQSMKLTNDYHATFEDDSVKVGCQTITRKKVRVFIQRAVKYFGFTPEDIFIQK